MSYLRNLSDKTLDSREKSMKNKYLLRFEGELNFDSLLKFLAVFFFRKNHLSDRMRRQSNLVCIKGVPPSSGGLDYSRSRSYIDAYICAIHYFPDLKFRDFYRVIRFLCGDGVLGYNEPLPFGLCSTVGRLVCGAYTSESEFISESKEDIKKYMKEGSDEKTLSALKKTKVNK